MLLRYASRDRIAGWQCALLTDLLQLEIKLSPVSHLKVYRKSEIPGLYHYQDNARIGELLAVADDQWTIVRDSGGASIVGDHGYVCNEENAT